MVLETRVRELQQDILERRAAVDTLASRLANLSRLRRYQEGRRAEQEASFKTAAKLIVECTKSVASADSANKGGQVIKTGGAAGDANMQR